MQLRWFSLGLVLCLAFLDRTFAQNYADQFYALRGDSLLQSVESSDGTVYSGDSAGFVLQQDRSDGYVIFAPQSSQYPFNEGLPSWNGSAPDDNSSFQVKIRFPYGTGWSPWLTVGYWKAQIWSSYGATQFGGGYIDIDNAKLNSYVNSWQFMVTMKRTSLAQPSPVVRKLGLFLSDSRTTTGIDYTKVLNDRPAAILVPTNFIYQYGVDPQIGGSICSPTSVAMILRSYSIPVDPLQFARDTYDPYYGIFGIWPRVVQNASEYGLDGAVTRYRSWSQAREVLQAGGRIALSVGLPLYSGHLMMLAGFTAGGDPIVHDPARSDGYAHLFSKSDLSHSWFDKGGVAYTFYQAGQGPTGVSSQPMPKNVAQGFSLEQNYPNPFNPTTKLRYSVGGVVAPSGASPGGVEGPAVNRVRLVVYDLLGRQVATLVDEAKAPGAYEVQFNASGLSSGVYYYRLTEGNFSQTRAMMLIK